MVIYSRIEAKNNNLTHYYTHKKCAKCDKSNKRYASSGVCVYCVKMGRQKWRMSNVEKNILQHVRNRANSNDIPFNLTIDDIVIPDTCPILNMKIINTLGTGTTLPNTPSVDRIIPELGYTKGNVRVISNRANRIKSYATKQEIEQILKYMEHHIKNS
jgi:hypothetical protein